MKNLLRMGLFALLVMPLVANGQGVQFDLISFDANVKFTNNGPYGWTLPVYGTCQLQAGYKFDSGTCELELKNWNPNTKQWEYAPMAGGGARTVYFNQYGTTWSAATYQNLTLTKGQWYRVKVTTKKQSMQTPFGITDGPAAERDMQH